MMLFEFIDLNRNDIVNRMRTKVRGRSWPSVSDQEIEHGVPLFPTQLADTLRLETTAQPFPSGAVGATATRHGAELLAALQRRPGRARLRRHLPGHYRNRDRAGSHHC
jgi:hypothetical protein